YQVCDSRGGCGIRNRKGTRVKSFQRTAHKVWCRRFPASGSTARISDIVITFECSGGSPRFPSYLLSLDKARALLADLSGQLERAEADNKRNGVALARHEAEKATCGL